MRLVTTPATQQDNPLLKSICPFVRLGPVFGPLLIVDGLCVVAPGSPDLDGNFTAWSTTDPAMVRDAVTLWDRTWHLSRPGLEEGAAPPLTSRQVEVAQLHAQGFTDRVIARRVDRGDGGRKHQPLKGWSSSPDRIRSRRTSARSAFQPSGCRIAAHP